MKEAAPSARALRFGVFEVDQRAGELRKHGIRIKLQDQPFQVLVMLLENAGEVVTREELRSKLWPADTFVDFDHGLNSAINKLREALGDSAENPRFIETLPRRGYRFAAPVDSPASASAAAEAGGLPADRESPPNAGAPAAEAQISPATDGPRAAKRPQGRWALGTVAALVGLFALLAGLNVGGLRQRLLGGPSAKPIQSIAVLPLENLSRDPEQEYFADGMTDELITQLAKIEALRVVSRTSVMRYKGVKKPLPEIGRELGVDAVVEGSVLRSGARVRISAQLILASADRHLWAESYERDLREILALQSDVASAIAAQIQVKVTPQEKERLAPSRQVNPQAYEAYLKGLHSWRKWTVEGFREAVEYYNTAIEKDPSYAKYYSALADAYVQLAGRLLPPREVMPKAKAAALKAAELDDKLAEAHTSLGFVLLYYEWAWQEADREYKRALALNPGYPLVHSVYAHYLAAQGRYGEAISEIKRASELEPSPGYFRCGEVRIYYYARQYDKAIELHRKARELDPNSAVPCVWMGMSYEQKGLFDEAIRQYQITIAQSGEETLPLAALGHAYAWAGKRAEANQVRNQLLALSKKRFTSPYDLAVLYVGLGDKEQAFAWLSKALDEREGLPVYMRTDPVFDPLRSDPRFTALLRRVGLPP